MPPLTHAVQPCVNKTTHVGFNVQKIDGLSLGDTKMPTEISEFLRVFLNRQQKLGASDFCSHSIFPDQQLLIHTEAPHIDLATCALRLDVHQSLHVVNLGARRYEHGSPEQVWTWIHRIHTTCLLVLRKHYVCAEALIFFFKWICIFCDRVTAGFCLFNEWMIYFMRAT